MTKLCRAGHAQRSGDMAALIPCPLRLPILFDLLIIWLSHVLPRAVTPSSFRELPAGTVFVGALQNEIKWLFLLLVQNNRTFYPRKYRLQCGVKIMIGGGLETKAVNYYGWFISIYIYIYIYFLLLYILYRKQHCIFLTNLRKHYELQMFDFQNIFCINIFTLCEYWKLQIFARTQ